MFKGLIESEDMPPSISSTYSGIERANHWIVSVTIILLLLVGWVLYLDILSEQNAHYWRDGHKAVGTLILAFGFWRVAYRLLRGFPASHDGIGLRQAMIARTVHYVLLTGIIIMPASGFAKSWFAGRPIDMFGLFIIGSPQSKNDALQEIASTVHFFTGIVLTVMIGLHMMAALKHHFVDQDVTLTRMLRG